MTPPTLPTPSGGGELRTRPLLRGRGLAALVLLLVALAGGLAGAAIERLVVRPHFDHRPFGPLGPDRERATRDRLARELALTPAQRVRIDSLLDRQLGGLHALRKQAQPQVDSIVTETRREIDAILTPEQRDKVAELARRGPPPGERRRGPPLGPSGDALLGPPPGGREPPPPPR